MWARYGFVFCHAILSLITIGEPKSGGSGGGGGDSVGGGCVERHNYTQDLKPFHYINYTRNEKSQKQYGGSFFLGEATFSVRFEKQDLLETNTSRSTACPADTLNLRLLGVAWIAPQTPSPAGSTNPFVLSFKAWLSDMPVENIKISYSQCSRDVDLANLMTTQTFAENLYTSSAVYRSQDMINMTVWPSPNNYREVLFNGTNLKPSKGYPLIQTTWATPDTGSRLRLPARTCRGMDVIRAFPPENTLLNGSLTNNTIRVRLAGVAIGQSNPIDDYSPANIKMDFNITFTGTFDRANSSQQLGIGQDDQSLISWKANDALALKIPVLIIWIPVCVASFMYLGYL